MQGYDSSPCMRHRARRHRPKFNLLMGRAAGTVRAGAAVHPDHAAAGGPRRRREDEQVERQLHRPHRAGERIFGKGMSISDELMWNYYELLVQAGGGHRSPGPVRQQTDESARRQSGAHRDCRALQLTSRCRACLCRVRGPRKTGAAPSKCRRSPSIAPKTECSPRRSRSRPTSSPARAEAGRLIEVAASRWTVK